MINGGYTRDAQRSLDEDRLEILKQINQLNKEGKEDKARMVELQKELLEIDNEINNAEIKLLETSRQTLEMRQDIKSSYEKGVELAQELLKTETNPKKIKALKEQIIAQKQYAAAISDTKDAAEKFIDSYKTGLSDIAEKLTQTSDGTDIFNGDIMQSVSLIKALQTEGFKGLVDEQENLLETMGGGRAIFARAGEGFLDLAKNGIELTGILDGLRSGFMTSTGATREMTQEFNKAFTSLAAVGVTAEDAYAAGEALHGNFTDFTEVTPDVQRELTKTTSVLKLHGIEQAQVAKNIQVATKALGLSADEAAKQQLRIAKFAENLGVAPNELASAFADAGPYMAKFTIDAEAAFQDLAKTAKVTGIEMNRILDIAGKFDTFDGAADQVGRLNAMLGGDFINTLELMEAESPAERFQMLTDAVTDAGKSFETMSYYEKLALTEAMGLKDVNELSMALSGNMDMLNTTVEQSEASMEAMAARAKANLSIQQQMDAIVTALTPTFVGLANAISTVLSYFQAAVEDPWISGAIKLVAIAAGAFSAYASVLGAVTTATAMWGVVTAVATMPVWGTVAAVTALVAAVGALGFLFFEKSYASNFLEGIGKVGDAFGFMGENAFEADNQMTGMATTVPAIGAGLSDAGSPAAASSSAGNTIVKVYIDGKEMTAKVVKEVKREFNFAR